MQWEIGNLDGAWCYCNHFCFHPCRFPIVARVPAVSSYVWIRILSISYNHYKCDQPCTQQCLHRPCYEKQTRELEWPPLQTRELWQKKPTAHMGHHPMHIAIAITIFYSKIENTNFTWVINHRILPLTYMVYSAQKFENTHFTLKCRSYGSSSKSHFHSHNINKHNVHMGH